MSEKKCLFEIWDCPNQLTGMMILHFTNFDNKDHTNPIDKHDITGCGHDTGGFFLIRGVYEICNTTGYSSYVRLWKLYTCSELFREY